MATARKQSSPGSRVLEGVERIHWETTSPLCFVGSTVACMHYLGEPVSNDYVMGISGGAFTFLWFPAWSPALCDLMIVGEEPIRQTFRALGYDYTLLLAYGRPGAEAARGSFRSRIVESIDRGTPAIAEGIVGPPEACVVAGYERGGEVLYGWSYFQERPDACFRAEDWEKACHGLILAGEKTRKPAPGQVLRDALEWAIELSRVATRDCTTVAPETSGMHYSGLATYDAMAEALGRDEDFPAGNLDVLTFRTYALSNDGLHLLWCKRNAAAGFLEGMADEGHPGANELRQAAEAYRQEVGVLRDALELAPVSFAPEAERLRLADRGHRYKLAAAVRRAKAPDERAVAHLEKALAVLKRG